MLGRKKHPFQGKFVQVTLRQPISVTDGVMTKSYPLSVTGYLIEVTDSHYLLGDVPSTPAMEVLKTEAILTEVIQKKSKKKKEKDALDEFDIPSDPYRIN